LELFPGSRVNNLDKTFLICGNAWKLHLLCLQLERRECALASIVIQNPPERLISLPDSCLVMFASGAKTSHQAIAGERARIRMSWIGKESLDLPSGALRCIY
jgi:hypothetical protein